MPADRPQRFSARAYHIAVTPEPEDALSHAAVLHGSCDMKTLKAVFFFILGLALGTGLSSF
ncbi:MAG TPA: hypothetical protein VIT22_06610 [Pseudoxanthomonas sp.]